MIKLKTSLLIITLLLTFPNLSFASYIPSSNLNHNNKDDFQVRLLIDSTQSLNIIQVEKRENEAVVIKPQLVIPSVENDYWFIVNYNNVLNTEITRYFGFDISCFEIADLYYKNQSGWVHIRNGLTIPIDNRTVYSRLPGFEVTFKPSENKTLYLHLRSKYLVPTKIVSKNTIDFKKTENTYLFIYWLYIGAAISILLYNLLLFIQLRDKVYLYYILYVTFLLMDTTR